MFFLFEDLGDFHAFPMMLPKSMVNPLWFGFSPTVNRFHFFVTVTALKKIHLAASSDRFIGAKVHIALGVVLQVLQFL